jgi:hypothetical protein
MMRQRTYSCGLLMTVAILAGCASPDVNPPAAKRGTGYVDFYADDTSGLCWQIQRLEKDAAKGRTSFEEFRPRTNDVVRLAFAPGEYLFGITFLNRAITETGVAHVVVEDGKITPVRVTLVETGKTMLERTESRVGGTFYGRSGRSTKIRASAGATFRVETETQGTTAYRPKDKMPFAG